jgi:recombination protein RecA
VAIDRLPPRRGDDVLGQTTGKGKNITSRIQTPLPRHPLDKRQNPWSRLEQALKVTDLILHNGGFGAVLMDLGNVPPLNARRIPLATWFRFRRAVDNTPTVFLLLTREPVRKPVRLWCCVVSVAESGGAKPPNQTARPESQPLEGLELEVEVMRRQTLLPRSPRHAASWQTHMNWS